MRRIALALFVLAAASRVVAADLPVVVSNLTTGASSHVDLTNTSNQPATAWTLVVTTNEGGGQTRRASETIDAYLSEVTRDFAGTSAAVDRLMPGQTRQMMLDPVASGAKAEVTAVVLEDGTALGDEEALASVFESRAKERDDLREVSTVFSAVLPSMKGTEALQALKQRFSTPAGSSESVAHQAVRQAIDSYLQRASAANIDSIDQLVRKYADIVRREYELAERHSRRK